MITPYEKEAKDRAGKLRKEMTPHERKLWYLFLRDYPIRFYKQRPIDRYIVDFYCAPAKLVVELDGSQHYEERGAEYDGRRTAFLESLGLRVERYSNYDIDWHFSAVCDHIDMIVRERMAELKNSSAL